MTIAKILAEKDPQKRIPLGIIRRYEIARSVEGEEAQRQVLLNCRENIQGFINDWCWTFDPRMPGEGLPSRLPFYLFPVQEELIDWIQECIREKENGLIEKSRDMGATWVFSGFLVHQWLFTNGFKGGIGSRKLQLVDRKGDPDSIFFKVRYLIDTLPSWFLPPMYNRRLHDNFCRVENPENEASLTGEGGDEIGRGGRNTCYLIDEHASLQRAEMVDQAVSQNTNTVFYLSTPKGSGNLFAQKRFGGKTRVFTLHWKDHPWKDEAWYESQKKKYNSVLIAQEVDIDYSASVEGVCIPAKWVMAAVDLELAKGARKVAGLDVGDTSAESVYMMREGPVVSRIEAWAGLNPTQTAWKARTYGEEDGIEKLQFDRVGVGAGVYGTYQTSEDEGRPLPFEYIGINTGLPPTSARYADAPEMKSKERFKNWKIELWWAMRLRFERTWEHVNGIQSHRPEDMISIPNDPLLIAQLSQPTVMYTVDGKMLLESKKQLEARGVASPDRADTLILSFANPQNKFAGAIVV